MKNKWEIMEKEIDLTQGCINRMAQNSFMVKGWLVTLVTVILALLPEKVNVQFVCIIVLLATICFWYLDAFFLRLERLYRWKYEWIISNRLESEDYYYDLNPMNKTMWIRDKQGNEKTAPTVIYVMFTKTLVPLYGVITAAAILIFLNFRFQWLVLT